MASSKFPSSQFFSEEFVVSCGSVLFRAQPSGLEICLLYEPSKKEWLLPKGRKDVGETIQEAAVRETYEETGFKCQILPVRMPTRAPLPGSSSPDKAAVLDDSTEALAVTVRQMGEKNIKLIWWFATFVPKGEKKRTGTQMENEEFDSLFMPAEEAIEKLSFKGDQEIAFKAYQYARESKIATAARDGA